MYIICSSLRRIFLSVICCKIFNILWPGLPNYAKTATLWQLIILSFVIAVATFAYIWYNKGLIADHSAAGFPTCNQCIRDLLANVWHWGTVIDMKHWSVNLHWLAPTEWRFSHELMTIHQTRPNACKNVLFRSAKSWHTQNALLKDMKSCNTTANNWCIYIYMQLLNLTLQLLNNISSIICFDQLLTLYKSITDPV